MALDLYAPVTGQPASLAAADAAREAREAGRYPRRLATAGYVTYLRYPEQHSNAAGSHAGWGETPEESYVAAYYWVNQAPWVVTVRAASAPAWARDEALWHATR